MAAASVARHPSGPPFANIGTLQCGLGVLVHGATKQATKDLEYETSAGRHFECITFAPAQTFQRSFGEQTDYWARSLGTHPWSATSGSLSQLLAAPNTGPGASQPDADSASHAKPLQQPVETEKMEARAGHVQSWMYTFSRFIPHACVRWPRFLKLAGFPCQFGSVRTLDV